VKIFIDSADYDEISEAYEWGIIDGITTNPSLLKKALFKREEAGEKGDLGDYIAAIVELASGDPVSLEVAAFECEEIVRQGKLLYDLFNHEGGNVNIKVPINTAMTPERSAHFEALRAIRKLSEMNIAVNCTLVFTPEQALLAAKAGAAYVSPFAGRVDDYLRQQSGIEFAKTDYYPAHGIENNGEIMDDNGIISGVDLVEQCVEVLGNYKLDCEVIAASLRNTRQVRECALISADIATLPYAVISEMLGHHKTFEGIELFRNDTVPEYQELLK